MKTEERYCPRCDGKLEIEKEKELDYPYVCLECDENFYEFETRETGKADALLSRHKKRIYENRND